MDLSTKINPRQPATVTRFLARSLVVVTVCVLLLATGTGAAAAGGGQGLACPGENPNVGLENAPDKAAARSFQGIATAFETLGCEGDWGAGA